jgi:hypothetical protein
VRTLSWAATCLTTVSLALSATAVRAGDWTLTEQSYAPTLATNWDSGFATPSFDNPSLDAALGLNDQMTTDGLRSERVGEAFFADPDGGFGRLRVVSSGHLRQPNGAPLLIGRPLGAAFDADAVDVSYVRGWPAALTITGDRYALDLTPHAGLGFGSGGGSAEAGATLRLGETARRLGIRNGSEFGDAGRWYLYAAASGRAVGYNFQRSDEGWSRSGLSTDEGAYIGDTQAGVGWRRGPMQASFGYIHREIKALGGFRGAGVGNQEDSVVAFSLSIKPQRK